MYCLLLAAYLLPLNPKLVKGDNAQPYHAKLQIREGIEDKSKIIFLFLIENICCDPSLEPSQ